jgi:nitroreductase
LAGLTIDWMRTLRNSSHPMSGFVQPLIAAWEQGRDSVCRGAPHLLIAHVPDSAPGASIDAIIALTHVDIAAPAFGIGTCWAGFLSMAAAAYLPMKEALALPMGRSFVFAMMFGYPRYKPFGIPRRNPVKVTYR